MTTFVRYKNGNLYNRDTKEWVTLETVREMVAGTYTVVSSSTKEDITAEVDFLARVDEVRRQKLWSYATVVVSQFKAIP